MPSPDGTKTQTLIDQYATPIATQENPWQSRSTKKRRINSPEEKQKTDSNSKTTSSLRRKPTTVPIKNKFSLLRQVSVVSASSTKTDPNDSNASTNAPVPDCEGMDVIKKEKISPIVVANVRQYSGLIKNVADQIGATNFTTSTLSDNRIKIQVNEVDQFRKLQTHFRNTNVLFHTFCLKIDRPFKVVLRGLHPSVDTTEIKNELTDAGFTVRNVSNIKHHRSKEPLPLFFVDLEPHTDPTKIYNLKRLMNSVVKFESPRPRHEPVQCKRCQDYGHTKTYCNKERVCVKCGENHDHTTCTKSSDVPACCGLCGGEHTANYRGCVVYKNYRASSSRGKRPVRILPTNKSNNVSPPINTMSFPSLPTRPTNPNFSYAATAQNSHQVSATNTTARTKTLRSQGRIPGPSDLTTQSSNDQYFHPNDQRAPDNSVYSTGFDLLAKSIARLETFLERMLSQQETIISTMSQLMAHLLK